MAWLWLCSSSGVANATNWSTIWLSNVKGPGNFECDLICVISILEFCNNDSPLICENNVFYIGLDVETTVVITLCTTPTT